ncbi:UvrD-helicase domain-containing protein [Cytobacillus oceanisediminis]|uniref:UvrD-helicase domain-containing protein n=1 Tax=Cytobacillus oceanisediminis TaxID=665099 RepID=UPI001CCE86AF|nr:UvrD-helicase domain-containing protein [Cytobacillus oceanisediminis]MBZ9533263.1 UvrD-helicase domain-containing protein [Cytobacillus oceanisediminis]
MTNIVVDQEARDKIKYELHTNFLVEAGAGSGKTTSLVERMVHLIYTNTCKIEQIVAITFTRKAADELKIRFQSKLESVWKTEEDIERKERLAEALQNIDRCFLGTVHSFCAKLLRERPIEASLDISFKELEDADDLELLEEAWQLFLQREQIEKSSLLAEIQELGIKVEELYDSLCQMRQYTDVEWVTDKVVKPELHSSFVSLMNLVKEAKRLIPEEEPSNGYDALQKIIVQALQKERFLDPSNDRDIIALLELFNKKIKVTQNRWPSKEDAKFYEGKFIDLVAVNVAPLVQQWKEYCHPKVVSFLQGAIHVYNNLKNERSLLNFQDLLIHTTDLLKENAEVRSYFQAKYTRLLVDEFQDTDPIQAQMMFYLTSQDLEEKVWTNCIPKNGSLFVVGDPKQAIYRFRRADIDTYNRVKQLIEEQNGEILQLTMNFRTIDTVTNELNHIFKRNLPEQETVYQAAYRPLNSFHKEDEQDRRDQKKELSGIKTLTISAEFSKKEEIIEEDARNITSTISSLLHQGYHPRDFMILTKYNDGMATYAQTLEDSGIAVSISGEVIIGEIREFQELSILLRTFMDPTDTVALLATLRGVFFGFSDNELYQWKRADGVFSLYSRVPENLPDKLKEKFASAWATLTTYLKWVRTLSPTIAIEKIVEDIGFYPLLLINGRNQRAYKSLVQVIEHIRHQESAGASTYKQVCQFLMESIYKKTTVLNIEEGANSVRVMNVHKAKGLEAPIVFLAHPAKLVSSESFLSQHIKREDDESLGYFSFSTRNGFQKKELALPIDWKSYKQEELLYLEEEELRILYVAATRAEKALIISSSAKGNKKNPWSKLFEVNNMEEFMSEEELSTNSKEKRIEITLQEYQTKTVGLTRWLENRKQKTFDYWSPTKDKDYSTVVSIERETCGGKEWGTIVHQVLEKVVKGQEVANYILSLLQRNNLEVEKKEEIIQMIEVFKRSSIWADLQIADNVLAEVPFMLQVDKESPLYKLIQSTNAEKHPYKVKGIIDLIYKIDGEWVIVDYKTDNPVDREDFVQLRNFYQDQLLFYKNAWEEMTGEKVNRTELFFINEQLKLSL